MIQALAFDAVHTLIHPEPPAWEVYATVGQRYGSGLSVAQIQARFRTAFARQEKLDEADQLRTSEERERQRWRVIVAEVLADVREPELCFAELYEHFRQPHAWRVGSAAAALLAELRQRGYRLALASNYDERLRSVYTGLSALRPVEHLVISSKVGWRKPARAFFAALCQQLDVPPEEILFVGDDRANDFDGPRSAGLQAVLYDPCNVAGDLGIGRIGALEELLALEPLSHKRA
jgi:putative hydrolase of the HAD superfamily